MQKSSNHNIKHSFYFLIPVIFLTVLIYSVSLKNEFISFDDPGYITENQLIRHLDFNGLKNIFSSFVMGNYHPVTVLFYALIFKIASTEPLFYHLFSIIFHLANIVLVYFLSFKLIASTTKTLKNKFEIEIKSAIIALLFAIHPMHAETVNWAADWKDLLYSAFYIASLIVYINWIKLGKPKYLLLSLFFFTLSLLSKPSAVTLTIVLFLLDYFYNRKINSKIFIEKIGFISLSIIFSIINIFAQQSALSFNDTPEFSIIQRLLIPFYSLFYYFYSSVLPFNLNIRHIFPNLVADVNFPFIYYFSPVIIISFFTIIFIFIKKYPNIKRDIILGLLFFILSISVVLHLKPFGMCVVAERYTYLPYFGLFYLMVAPNFPLRNVYKYRILAVFIIFFSFTTFQRNQDWKNNISLFTDEIKKSPENPMAYNDLGVAIMQTGDNNSAIGYFSKAIDIYPQYSQAYCNLGAAKRRLNDFKAASDAFNLAVKYDPEFAIPYFNIAEMHQMSNQMKLALQYYDKAIQLDKKYVAAYINRGTVKASLQEYDSAIKDFNFAISLRDDIPAAYHNRALTKMSLKLYNSALNDYSKAISLQPDYADAFRNRAIAWLRLNNKNSACNDLYKASQLGHTEAANLYSQFCQP